MNLFAHYESEAKDFPCDASGNLAPNFKREWASALGRSSFGLENKQNLRTWKREWPTLNEESKRAAMGHLMKRIRNLRDDDEAYTRNSDGMPSFLKKIEPYMSVFDTKDALLWTEAFTLSTMAERDSSSFDITTLTFAAHLLNWLRQSQPSALQPAVAMLQSWGAFASTKMYKNEDFVHWTAALENLSHVMPNNALEQVCALTSARAGREPLLVQLLSRPDTDVAALFQRGVSLGEPEQLMHVLSLVVDKGHRGNKDNHDVLTSNAHAFGAHLFNMYTEKKAPLPKSTATGRAREEGAKVGEFFQTLVTLKIACSKETLAFMTTQAPYLTEARYFDCLKVFSPSWSAKENETFFSAWNRQGGYFNSGNLFNASNNERNIRSARSVFSAMAVLPDYWAEWLQTEFDSSTLKELGPAIFPERGDYTIDVTVHRWAHDALPRVYQHWIRGMPANAQLLADPVLSGTAWEYTQAASSTFLFDSTFAWLKAPETKFDVHNKHFELAKLAWEKHGVNIDTALQDVMARDKDGDYRALIMEAILPGGRNRWEALQCVIHSFNDEDTSDSGGAMSKPMVSDFVRSCIQERLYPTKALVLTPEETGKLFV